MKKIDITTQAGLDLLKVKAKYYGHYAEDLMVLELIKRIEELEANTPERIEESHLAVAAKKLGW